MQLAVSFSPNLQLASSPGTYFYLACVIHVNKSAGSNYSFRLDRINDISRRHCHPYVPACVWRQVLPAVRKKFRLRCLAPCWLKRKRFAAHSAQTHGGGCLCTRCQGRTRRLRKATSAALIEFWLCKRRATATALGGKSRAHATVAYEPRGWRPEGSARLRGRHGRCGGRHSRKRR